MRTHNLLAGAVLASRPVLSSGLWDLIPEPTNALEGSMAVLNEVPAPTAAPQVDMELLRRQTSDDPDRTCGYINSILESSVTCQPGNVCATQGRGLAMGCCSSNLPFSACTLATSCVPFASAGSVASSVLADTFVTVCVSANPYCFTGIYPIGATSYTYIGCNVIRTTISVFQTAANAPATTTGTSARTTGSTGTSDTASTSGPAPTRSNTPEPEEKKTNVGAIVGGVVGGLAALGLIGGALIFFVFKKKRSTAATPPAGGPDMSQQQQPAPHPGQPPVPQQPYGAPGYPPAQQDAAGAYYAQQPKQNEYYPNQAPYGHQPTSPGFAGHPGHLSTASTLPEYGPPQSPSPGPHGYAPPPPAGIAEAPAAAVQPKHNQNVVELA